VVCTERNKSAPHAVKQFIERYMYVYSVAIYGTVTSSAVVAGHYSAVHVRMSLLDEVD
jgi:hypothetical protein